MTAGQQYNPSAGNGAQLFRSMITMHPWNAESDRCVDAILFCRILKHPHTRCTTEFWLYVSHEKYVDNF